MPKRNKAAIIPDWPSRKKSRFDTTRNIRPWSSFLRLMCGESFPLPDFVSATESTPDDNMFQKLICLPFLASVTVIAPGIDATFIGPYDLSVSMGLAGQLDHPDVAETISLESRKQKIVE